MNTLSLIVLIIAIVAIAIAVWAVFRREKTRKLKTTFGPEYDRVIDREKNPRRAETILEERQKRVEKYQIRPLTQEETDNFGAKWRVAQEHFVDDPREAVAQADSLITEAMRARGYPTSDFDQRAEDLSVDHPRVVDDFRTAHEIAMRDTRGLATTEDLRKAMRLYRSLFEHVLDTRVVEHR